MVLRLPKPEEIEDAAVGGYVIYCGWNSTMEGVSAGVPMITWPLSSEQFFNENFITDVIKGGEFQ